MSDAAIASLVTGVVTVTTIIVGFLTLWIKIRYGVEKAEEAAVQTQIVEKKLDNNTAITKEGQQIAAIAVKAAAATASNAAQKAEALSQQLNGKLDTKITTVVKEYITPIVAMIKEHSTQDEKNMEEIRKALAELKARSK